MDPKLHFIDEHGLELLMIIEEDCVLSILLGELRLSPLLNLLLLGSFELLITFISVQRKLFENGRLWLESQQRKAGRFEDH